MTIDFTSWTTATHNLDAGPQAIFLDFLNLVSEGQAHLVYGADYRDGKPCLVNGVAQMMSHTSVSPMSNCPQVVSAFDNMCGAMASAGLHEDAGYVSPLMADVLIQNFGDVKPIVLTEVPADTDVTKPGIYVEPSDAAMSEFMLSMTAPAPEVVADADVTTPEVEYTRSFVNVRRT